MIYWRFCKSNCKIKKETVNGKNANTHDKLLKSHLHIKNNINDHKRVNIIEIKNPFVIVSEELK